MAVTDQLRVTVGPASGTVGVAEITDFSSFSFVANLIEGCEVSIACSAKSIAAQNINELDTDAWVYIGTTLLQRFRLVQVAQTWTADGDDTIQARGVCYRKILSFRLLNNDLSFTSTNQGDIAWALVQDTQLSIGGYLGMTSGTLDATVQRNRTYEAGSNIGQLLTNLSNVIGGPRIIVDGDKTFSAVVTGAYPVLATPIVIGATARSLQRAGGSGFYANVVRGTGDDEQTTPVLAGDDGLLSYVNLTTGVVTSPDDSIWDLQQDRAYVALIRPDDWSDGTEQCIAAKGNNVVAAERGWTFQLGATGTLEAYLWNGTTYDGAVAGATMESLGAVNGEWRWVACTISGTTTGTLTYRFFDGGGDPFNAEWTLFDTITTAGPETVQANTIPIAVGRYFDGNRQMEGDVAVAEFYDFSVTGDPTDPQSGDLVGRFDAQWMASGAAPTTGVDPVSGKTWTTAAASTTVTGTLNNFGRWEQGVSWSSVIQQSTLIENTEGELQERVSPEGGWIVEIERNRWLTDCQVKIGNQVTLVIPPSTVAPVGTPATSTDALCVEFTLNASDAGDFAASATLVELPSGPLP